MTTQTASFGLHLIVAAFVVQAIAVSFQWFLFLCSTSPPVIIARILNFLFLVQQLLKNSKGLDFRHLFFSEEIFFLWTISLSFASRCG